MTDNPTSAKAARVTDEQGRALVKKYREIYGRCAGFPSLEDAKLLIEAALSIAPDAQAEAILAEMRERLLCIAPDAEPVALQTRLIEVLRHLTFPPEHNYRSPISMHPVWLENEWVNKAQDLLQEIDARALIAKLDAAPLPAKDAEPYDVDAAVR
jgi:hypothetical protein